MPQSSYYLVCSRFQRIIENYDVTIPSMVLRDVEKFDIHETKFSFVGDNVHAKGQIKITSPLAIMRVKYCDRNDPLAQNRTVKAEYLISESYYDYEMIARPETKTVEVANIGVHVSGATLAPTQGLYGDERDLIIRHLIPYIKVYYPNNGYYTFAAYTQGLVAEGMSSMTIFIRGWAKVTQLSIYLTIVHIWQFM